MLGVQDEMTVFLAVKVPYRVTLFSKEKNSKGCCPFESEAPSATDVFVHDGDVTTDKKLGLERFQLSVATKQTSPDMLDAKSRNYFTCKTCIAKVRNCDF